MSLFQRIAKVQAELSSPSPITVQNTSLMGSFPGGQVMTEPFGTYYLIEQRYPGRLLWPPVEAEQIYADLQLVKGIGPVTEQELKRQGYDSLRALATHPQWGKTAGQIIELIQQRRFRLLGQLGMADRHLLSFFQPQELVCLDIESTGLWASQPLFLVGILYMDGQELVVRQYLARNFGEEKPLLAALMRELAQFSMLVTFNGKRFDVPYIEGRNVEHRLFHKFNHSHIDLLHHARRHYKWELPNCRLITLEEHILQQFRKDDVPGYLIPELYHKFTRNQDPRLIQGILEHNVLDLLALAKFIPLVDTCRYSPCDSDINILK